MSEAASFSESIEQRRRSTRISQNIPLVIRGMDLLGQPFEERTTTTNFNFHGCKYPSKHHLPRNTWVTLESLQREAPTGPACVRARVVWIQRPHTVRDLFQIAVELESPTNVWGVSSTPEDWNATADQNIAAAAGDVMGMNGGDVPQYSQSSFEQMAQGNSPNPDEPMSIGEADFQRWRDQFEREHAVGRELLAAQMIEKIIASGEETKSALKGEIEASANAIRAEVGAADNTAALAEMRARLEEQKAGIETLLQRFSDSSDLTATETVPSDWRQKIEQEMEVARGQWNELLQSSLDSAVERLSERLGESSQSALAGAERRIEARLSELTEPAFQAISEAKDAFGQLKSSVEQSVGEARASLEGVEQAALRVRDEFAKFEAVQEDALARFRSQLEGISEARSAEINRRAESATADVIARVTPTIEAAAQESIARITTEMETKLVPTLERTQGLLSRLSARELQGEDSLRLHRERLRQADENSRRELDLQRESALADMRAAFESAQAEALAKYAQELESNTMAASQGAAESIGQAAEFAVQQMQARMQNVVEETLRTTGEQMEQNSRNLVQQFSSEIDWQRAAQSERLQAELAAAGETVETCKRNIEEAARVAAASFGEVVGGISEQTLERFRDSSRLTLDEKTAYLENSANLFHQNFEANANASVQRLHEQISFQAQQNLNQMGEGFRMECGNMLESLRQEVRSNFDLMGAELVQSASKRLEEVSDTWRTDSLRQLNEEAKGALTSVIRSGEQAMKNSFLTMFETMAQAVRDNPPGGSGNVHPADQMPPNANQASPGTEHYVHN